MGLDFFVK